MSEQQYTDEFFINLTMDYDHRDDEVYPKWAVWCAKSNDRYVIDGKDHHFYTRVRTDEEIALERKKRQLMEFSFQQRAGMDIRPGSEEFESFRKYELYLHEAIFREKDLMNFTPKTYAQWKSESK